MKVIKQSAHIVKDWPRMNLYERCEFAGRISHASEGKIKEGSAEEFVRRMVKLGHESVFEFARIVYQPEAMMNHKYTNIRFLREDLTRIARCVALKYPAFFCDIDNPMFWRKLSKELYWEEANDWIPVLIVTNRAISHQLVRYRKDVVYLQASQRFIKFHDDVDFISPDVYFDLDDKMYSVWLASMEGAEQDYIHCLSQGYSAQAARLFLPNSAATKLIMYASPATWKHVFEQRLTKEADPMIRELLIPLKEQFDKEGLL